MLVVELRISIIFRIQACVHALEFVRHQGPGKGQLLPDGRMTANILTVSKDH